MIMYVAGPLQECKYRYSTVLEGVASSGSTGNEYSNTCRFSRAVE